MPETAAETSGWWGFRLARRRRERAGLARLPGRGAAL